MPNNLVLEISRIRSIVQVLYKYMFIGTWTLTARVLQVTEESGTMGYVGSFVGINTLNLFTGRGL